LIRSSDTWTALASGAHVLAENYLYTSETIQDAYARLRPEGILHIVRFAATMESLRLLANVDHALTVVGAGDIRDSVICLATWDQLFSVILKKGRFTDRGGSTGLSGHGGSTGVHPEFPPGHQPDDR